MKRVQGTKGVQRMECINADMNKWSVRWDIQDNPSEEGKTTDGINYMEETFLFKPELSDVQSVISIWCTGEEPDGCFILDEKTIALDLNGILLLRYQAENAEKEGETDIPLITDAGVIEVAPKEALYIANKMLGYYSAYQRNISNQLTAIGKAESIDALTAFDFRAGYPKPGNMTTEEVRTAISNQKPTLQDQAVSFARMTINTVELSDGDALAVKDLHPSWESFIGKEMKKGTRSVYGDKLFRARQDISVVLENQPLSIDTAALYEEINEENAGTLDDPIPYNNNMELFAGKYYSQNGTVYRCTRDTGQAVYQDLADLVGIYVEKVE